jgi:hypothetical protein
MIPRMAPGTDTWAMDGSVGALLGSFSCATASLGRGDMGVAIASPVGFAEVD